MCVGGVCIVGEEGREGAREGGRSAEAARRPAHVFNAACFFCFVLLGRNGGVGGLYVQWGRG